MSSIVAKRGTATTVNWSEQSVLDCGTNGGCDGDWPETALEQAKNSGVANTSDYPYTGEAGPCSGAPHPNLIADYGYVGAQDGVASVQAIKNAMATYGPISCAVAADDAFTAYTGGVFTDSGSTEIDHAILLVGWQDDPTISGGGYWILRNSWGESWGEQGYMRIAYGANQVGYGAMWASCAAAPPPVPPAPAPTPNPNPAVPFTITVNGTEVLRQPGDTLTIAVPAIAKKGCKCPAPKSVTSDVLAVLVALAQQALPVIAADVIAGKSAEEILADLAGLLAPPSRAKMLA